MKNILKKFKLTERERGDILIKWHFWATDRFNGCSAKGVDNVVLKSNRLCQQELIKAQVIKVFKVLFNLK